MNRRKKHPELIKELQSNYVPNLFFPYNDVEYYDIINGKKYNTSFKSVCLLIALEQETGSSISGMQYLGCEDIEEYILVMNQIGLSRWVIPETESIESLLTDEEKKKLREAEKKFDMLMDFDSYYYDFRKIGIDLIREDIPYFEFNFLLNGMLEDDNTNISKRLNFRNYKPTKNEHASSIRYHSNKKRLYSYQDTSKDAENMVSRMIGDDRNGK